jgi:glutaconate CoA-transferase subunit B
VTSYCWKTIIVMMHEVRRFVPRVDFITSPGYLDGTPGARERAGLPAGTGPWRVVTSKALFGFDDPTKKLTLTGVLEGLTPEAVLEGMEMKPLIAERVEVLAPPTSEELRILREEIDPARAITGRSAK